MLRRGAAAISPMVLRSNARHTADISPAAPAEIRPGIIAATAHWSAPNRTQFLAAYIAGIARQGEPFSVAVLTNGPQPVDAVRPTLQRMVDDLCEGVEVRTGPTESLLGSMLPTANRVFLADWRGRGHPYRLTWQHKELFRDLVARPDLFDRVGVLMYLEDDMQLADGGLEYWRTYRPRLAARGLIPGYLRLEGPQDDVRVAGWPRSVGEPAPFAEPAPAGTASDDTLWFAAMSNPYQAMFVLDEGLARPHFRASLFRSRVRSKYAGTVGSQWGVPERAAAGPLFDAPLPAGYEARAVVPLVRQADGSAMPYGPATTDHVSRNYYVDANTPMSKQPLAGAFRLDRV
ncbi:MAG: hypothetical protein ACKO2C_05880 [Actinomycetes bacterium]